MLAISGSMVSAELLLGIFPFELQDLETNLSSRKQNKTKTKPPQKDNFLELCSRQKPLWVQFSDVEIKTINLKNGIDVCIMTAMQTFS